MAANADVVLTGNTFYAEDFEDPGGAGFGYRVDEIERVLPKPIAAFSRETANALSVKNDLVS